MSLEGVSAAGVPLAAFAVSPDPIPPASILEEQPPQPPIQTAQEFFEKLRFAAACRLVVTEDGSDKWVASQYTTITRLEFQAYLRQICQLCPPEEHQSWFDKILPISYTCPENPPAPDALVTNEMVIDWVSQQLAKLGCIYTLTDTGQVRWIAPKNTTMSRVEFQRYFYEAIKSFSYEQQSILIPIILNTSLTFPENPTV